ncbi:MAG: ABC transporter ATP-binding protein [Tissierellia bacterium]|nr:ABC transporter ATP-binding protein [Tissierellia bacterium]
MFKIFRDFKDFFKKYRKNQIIGTTAIMLSYISILLQPYIVGLISNGIKADTVNREELLSMIGLFLILIITSYGIDYIWGTTIFKNVYLIDRDTRNEIMDKVLRQTPEFFEKNSIGSIMGKATNDLRAMSVVVGYGLMAFFDGIVYPLLIFILMLKISWKLTIVATVILPIIIILLTKVGETLNRKFEEVQKSFDRMNESALESVTAIRVLRAFGVEDIFTKRFDKRILDNYKKDMERIKVSAIFVPTSMFAMGIMMAIIMFLGGRLISAREITVGGLISFTMYMGMLEWPSYAISDLITVAKEGSASIERIKELLRYKETVIEKPNAKIIAGFESLEFKNFNFKYPSDDRMILKDINLKIEKGETIGIVGKTGSGKSTLIYQMLREYNFDSGELLLNNQPIEDYKFDSIHRLIGYVPQENFLFSKTIRENIKFFRKIDDKEIEKAIKNADFEKDLASLNEGLETLTGEKGIALSGGQKQRVSLARALVNNPQVLILDDVLSAVDTKTEQRIIENLKALRQGKTNIIASHRLSVIKDADKILVLEDGKISQIGTHKELYLMGGWYKEQYDKQMGEAEDEE